MDFIPNIRLFFDEPGVFRRNDAPSHSCDILRCVPLTKTKVNEGKAFSLKIDQQESFFLFCRVF